MDFITPGVDGIFNGCPLFADVTIISSYHNNSIPMSRSANVNGASLIRADQRNRNDDYPDVEQSPHAALLCLGCETYGRWSDHCLTLVKQLAKFKSRNSPQYLQQSLQQSCYARWWSLLACTVQVIVAESILRPQGSDLLEAANTVLTPTVQDLLDLHR